MATTSTSKAARSATEKAAMQLLQRKAALVGDAKVALDERTDLAASLDKATSRYADSYTQARDAGWTAEELDQLGLPAPDADTTKRRRPARDKAPTQPTMAEPNRTHVTDGQAAAAVPSQPAAPAVESRSMHRRRCSDRSDPRSPAPGTDCAASGRWWRCYTPWPHHPKAWPAWCGSVLASGTTGTAAAATPHPYRCG